MEAMSGREKEHECRFMVLDWRPKRIGLSAQTRKKGVIRKTRELEVSQ